MMRRSKIALAAIALLLTVVVAAGVWITRTSPGGRWLFDQLAAQTPGTLQAASINGSLASGLEFEGLHYTNDSVRIDLAKARLNASLQLFPLTLRIQPLTASTLVIDVLPEQPSADSSSWQETLEALELPFMLELRDLRVEALTLRDGDNTWVDAQSVNLSADWHQNILVHDIHVSTAASEWQASGRLRLAPPFALKLAMNTELAPAILDSSAGQPAMIHTSADGNLTRLMIQSTSEQPSLSAAGELFDLLQNPRGTISLTTPSLAWPWASNAAGAEQSAADVRARDVTVTVQGTLQQHDLTAQGSLEITGMTPAEVQLEGSGDGRGLSFERVAWSSDEMLIQGQGDVQWLDTVQASVDVDLKQLNINHWLDQWPAQHPLSGPVKAQWQPGRVAIAPTRLKAQDTDLLLALNGVLDLDQDTLAADISWQDFNWPMNAKPGSAPGATPDTSGADFTSRQGSLRISGRPSAWTAAGGLSLRAGAWPEGQLELSGSGDTESAHLVVAQGQVLGGRFGGELDYRWVNEQPWSARLSARNIDITPLLTDYPGRVNAELNATGQSAPLRADIDIQRLDGTVRGRAITASGGVAFSKGELTARKLTIRSGESFVNLDGNPRDAKGISFSTRIESAGAFIEDAAGRLEGEGMVSIAGASPRIALRLQGSKLRYQDWVVDTLEIDQRDGLQDGSNLRLILTDVAHAEQRLDRLELQSSGANALDQITLSASSNETYLQAQLVGDMSPLQQLPAFSWQGRIESLRLSNEQLGFLEMTDPAPLQLQNTAAQLDKACFIGPQQGHACVDGQWKSDGTLVFNMNLDSISLGMVQLFLDSRLQLSHTLTGQAQWNKMPGRKPYASARIRMSPGDIRFDADEAPVRTGAGVLEFDLNEGQLLTGVLDIDIPDSGTIDATFRIADFSFGLDSAMEGRVQVRLNRIAPLLQWLPYVDNVSGAVEADVRLAGTLGNPRLTGHASLVRGHVEQQASGLVFSDIQLAGAVYEFNYTELNGSFRSGAGRGQLRATVKFDDFLSPDITLQLKGSNLTAFNVPDLSVTANPDLKLEWKDGLLTLGGDIAIPQARLAPSYLPAASATESPDLVIVAGAEPKKEENGFDRSNIRISGSVGVELGEDVTVTLERATAQLQGRTVFSWNNELLPRANGAFAVTGKISAYGQLLEVSEGRISFPNIPADNPHLNIRAEREIYGNVQVKTAGVLVTGTLKRPVLETYTDPPTTQERALTLLVTGHDFDYEQGVGAVEVGMYIAPRLYVSYGIGLFESQSVISARYDLGKGFGIKATSGQRETGADISYTIEN